jgi:hypothetical protein
MEEPLSLLLYGASSGLNVEFIGEQEESRVTFFPRAS